MSFESVPNGRSTDLPRRRSRTARTPVHVVDEIESSQELLDMVGGAIAKGVPLEGGVTEISASALWPKSRGRLVRLDVILQEQQIQSAIELPGLPFPTDGEHDDQYQRKQRNRLPEPWVVRRSRPLLCCGQGRGCRCWRRRGRGRGRRCRFGRRFSWRWRWCRRRCGSGDRRGC